MDETAKLKRLELSRIPLISLHRATHIGVLNANQNRQESSMPHLRRLLGYKDKESEATAVAAGGAGGGVGVVAV